jgi:hypothetical protein
LVSDIFLQAPLRLFGCANNEHASPAVGGRCGESELHKLTICNIPPPPPPPPPPAGPVAINAKTTVHCSPGSSMVHTIEGMRSQRGQQLWSLVDIGSNPPPPPVIFFSLIICILYMLAHSIYLVRGDGAIKGSIRQDYTNQREWGVLLDKPAGKERMEVIVKTELYPGKYQSLIVLTDEHPLFVSLLYGTSCTCTVHVESVFIPDPIIFS